MKKTYITTMPDQAGAFLRASEIIASEGGNIVRVNYNKAVDLHMLFLDVEAGPEQIHRITDRLREIGYLATPHKERQVMLFEMKLPDMPGAVKPVLEILSRYEINISYMNSKGDGVGHQHFKMGVLVEQPSVIKKVLDEISSVCELRILEYSVTEKVLDSAVFYLGFAGEMQTLLGLDQKTTSQFIIDSNKIMQFLDERNENPLKTFEYIANFAKFIVEHKGAAFRPETGRKRLSERVVAHIIEPPCGSNTYVLDDGQELLIIDGGFQCYLEELHGILRGLIPGFDTRKKRLALTHADIDHTGLSPLFDEILCSESCRQNFLLETQHEPNFREQNPLHAPYCRLSKIISGYTTPPLEKLRILGQKQDIETLSHIGTLDFADLHFDLYEGNGGHVRGETIYVDRRHRVLFTGDNWVNIAGFSKGQRAFNMLAPYLMTSVNVDSQEATASRLLLNQWAEGCLICPGHGMWEQIPMEDDIDNEF